MDQITSQGDNCCRWNEVCVWQAEDFCFEIWETTWQRLGAPLELSWDGLKIPAWTSGMQTPIPGGSPFFWEEWILKTGEQPSSGSPWPSVSTSVATTHRRDQRFMPIWFRQVRAADSEWTRLVSCLFYEQINSQTIQKWRVLLNSVSSSYVLKIFSSKIVFSKVLMTI